MKKTMLILFTAMLFVNLFGTIITKQEAKNIAINWYSHYNEKGEDELSIINEVLHGEDNFPLFYVIEFNQGGYVIVAGESKSIPVLGYSFNSELLQHSSMKDWYKRIGNQIREIRKDDFEYYSNQILWKELLSNNFNKYNNRENSYSIYKHNDNHFENGFFYLNRIHYSSNQESRNRNTILVWEGVASATNYSGEYINNYLTTQGFTTEYTTTFPTSLLGYSAVFLSFGNFGTGGTNYTVLTSTDAAKVQEYLENAGRLYLESGDALGWDQRTNTTLHNLFGLTSVADGTANVIDELNGQTGTLTEGMQFLSSTQTENTYVDQFTVADGAIAFIENGYGNVAAQYEGTFNQKTFCFSYALAELVDNSDPSTKDNLLDEIIDFFALGKFPISPSSLDFGSVLFTMTSQQTIYMNNETANTVNISSATITGTNADQFSIQNLSIPLAIPAETTTTFEVVYTPNIAGSVSADLEIVDDISRTTHTIPLSGIGDPSPHVVTNASPANNETNISVSGAITWNWGENTDTYDLWFGTTGNMAEVVTGATASSLGSQGSYSYSELLSYTNYQWQLILHNNEGYETEGEIYVFFTGIGNNQIQIGNDVIVDQHIPIEPYYGYTYSQTIYQGSDFAGVTSERNITAIYYNYHKVEMDVSDDWQVFMGTTDLTNLDAGWFPLGQLTEVFNGNVGLSTSPDGDGWLRIELDNSFTFNPSTHNLVVAVDENTPTYSSNNDEFYCTASSENVSKYFYNDTTNPDPASPPASGTSSGTIAYYPNTIFELENINPPAVVNPINQITMHKNTNHTTVSLETVFDGADSFLISGDTNTNGVLNPDNTITFTSATDWYGNEVVTVTAQNVSGSTDHLININVQNTFTFTEDFDHSGSLPSNWTTQHNGSTSNQWQPVNDSGDDFSMQVSNDLFQTASEILLSELYDFSQMTDIEVEFYNDIQTNTGCQALFQLSTNGITWQTIHSFPEETSSSGVEPFDITTLAEGHSNVRFRWGYSTNDFDPNHWYIDDFLITGIQSDNTSPNNITDFLVVSANESTISLNWSPSSDDYFSHYEIYISTDDTVDETDQIWDHNDDNGLVNPDTGETIVTGLTGDTNYWLGIKGFDTYGNSSDLSNIETTFCSIPPSIDTPVPDQIVIPFFDTQTVDIGVTIHDVYNVDASSIQYRIDANGNGIYDGSELWTDVTHTRVSTRNSKNLKNRSYERYDDAIDIIVLETVTYTASGNDLKFEFRAKDSAGSEYSYSGNSSTEGIIDDYFVAIDITNPTNVSDLDVTGTTSTSATLTWSSVTEQNFDHYEVYYSIQSGVDETDNIWNNTNDTALATIGTTTTTVQGLDADTNYWFRIVGVDLAGNTSNLSNEVCTIPSSELPECDSAYPGSASYHNSQTVTIGCTFHDYYGIDDTTIQYCFDADGSGAYDGSETWITYTPARSKLTQNRYEDYYQHYEVRVDVTYNQDGNDLKYEFRAWDIDGFGPVYSGDSEVEGITDDWGVYIDTTPPTMDTPYPAQTSYPIFNSQTVDIGVSIHDISMVDASTIQYRIDANGNGIYDGSELWTDVTHTRIFTKENSKNIKNRSDERYDDASDITVLETVTYTGSGNDLKFEFRAKDINGSNYTYSGSSNIEGISDDYFVAIDITAPTDVSDLNVTGTTSTSATLSWSAITELNFDHYVIYYSDEAGVDETDNVWDNNNDSALSNLSTETTTITGLTDGLDYWFRIVGIDAVGLSSNLSNEATSISESDLPECDSPYPDLSSYHNIQTVTIGCTFHDYFGIDDTTIQYRFDADGSGAYDGGETWITYTPARSKLTQNRYEDYYQHYEVRVNVTYNQDGNDLKYEFRAWDIDGFGPVYSGDSEVEGITDDWGVNIDTTPPVDIGVIAVTSSTENSISVGWTVSDDTNFSHYELYYDTEPEVDATGNVWDDTDDPALGIIGSSYVLTEVTGLQPATTYYFKVRAVDLADNTSNLSTETNGTTLSNAEPLVPANITIQKKWFEY